MARFSEDGLVHRPCQTKERRNEKGQENRDGSDDGSGGAHEMNVAESHGFLAEDKGAEDTCGPDNGTPDEIAEDAAEYAGNNGLLHDVDPPCVEGRDVLKEQPATGGRCEYRGKEENFAEGFEAVVKIRLLVLILRTVVGMLGVFIAASDETRGQGEQRDGQANDGGGGDDAGQSAGDREDPERTDR